MNKTSQLICTWCGPVGMLLLVLGVWPLAHFLPPLSPVLNAQEIANTYSNNTMGIRLGAIVVTLSAAMYAPFWAQLSVLMKRMEGENAPYAITQAITGAGVVVFIALGGLLFSVTAFRPDRAPEMTQLMNDLSWIVFVTSVAPAFVQTVAIGLAILGDSNVKPLLPRWTGFFSVWVGIMFLPGAFGMMFHTGPFAWNGILAFWIPVAVVGMWTGVMAYQMLKAIKSN